MALVLDDRVQETTTTTGTGTVTLLGAALGYQSFSVIGNANTTYYTIAGQTGSEWETGLGTYTSSGTTLARTTVLDSSNGGSLVNFSAGTKNVFVTYPASEATLLTGTQTLTNKTLTSPTIASIVNTGTLTLPTSTDTLVGRATTDTLTNKTIQGGTIASGTAVTLTIQATVDFTSLPSYVKRITIMFNGVSLSGTDTPLIQLGYGGTPTYVTSGYSGGTQNLTTAPASGAAQPGNGFSLRNPTAANVNIGIMTLVLLDSATYTWVATYSGFGSTIAIIFSNGSVALSGTLTAVRLTRSGTNTFDAGTINILYE